MAVRDSSTRTPNFTGAPVPATAYGGRGMLLIDSVAARWGSLPLDDGKVVWALLQGEEPGAERVRWNAPGTSMTDPARG